MKNFTKLLLTLSTIFSFLTLAPFSFAQTLNACPQGGGSAGKFSALCNLDIGKAIGGIISFLFILAALIALIYLIYGGIRWITSGGDKSNVEAARDSIIASIIGLVVVFLSYVIINVVMQFFFGFNLLGGFVLPTLQ